MNKRNRVSLQPAFILHRRAYRETSLLLDVFTSDYGRLSLVARGVRSERSSARSLIQPFVPRIIHWKGKTELMNLVSAESNGAYFFLQGDSLFNGFYLNELLIRVLQPSDPHPILFETYHDTLLALQNNCFNEKILRLFEKKLLIELGYGLFSMNQSFLNNQFYQFDSEKGFVECKRDPLIKSFIFSGKSLLSFANEELTDPESLFDAKRLIRLAFRILLGIYDLHSRKLFQCFSSSPSS